MADPGGDICAMCCGGCCLFMGSALGSWFNTTTYGADGCCGKHSNAGCCGSCCSKSFDEDAFDEQVKRDLEKTRDPSAAPSNTQQMVPTEGMSVQPLEAPISTTKET